jgi:hypothetical protein
MGLVSFSLSGRDHPGVPSNSGASPGTTFTGSVRGGALGRRRSHAQTRSREAAKDDNPFPREHAKYAWRISVQARNGQIQCSASAANTDLIG